MWHMKRGLPLPLSIPRLRSNNSYYLSSVTCKDHLKPFTWGCGLNHTRVCPQMHVQAPAPRTPDRDFVWRPGLHRGDS